MLNDIKVRLTNIESIIKNYDININKNTKLNDNELDIEEFKVYINKENNVNNNDNITKLFTSIDKNKSNKINIKEIEDYDINLYIINSIIVAIITIFLVIGLTWYSCFNIKEVEQFSIVSMILNQIVLFSILLVGFIVLIIFPLFEFINANENLLGFIYYCAYLVFGYCLYVQRFKRGNYILDFWYYFISCSMVIADYCHLETPSSLKHYLSAGYGFLTFGQVIVFIVSFICSIIGLATHNYNYGIRVFKYLLKFFFTPLVLYSFYQYLFLSSFEKEKVQTDLIELWKTGYITSS